MCCPEVNFREHVTCMPSPSVNKAALFGLKPREGGTSGLPKRIYKCHPKIKESA